MPDEQEFRTLSIRRTDAAAIVEGLTLLTFFEAKEGRKRPLPYNAASLAEMIERVMTRWPELRATYEPNRAERRAAKR